ncbi:MAG: twin-arginine translocase subunit TatC [Candidatus Omnitrophota bacterium]
MSPLYPEESKKLDVISHLEELRKRILWCVGIIAAASCGAFFAGDRILAAAKKPIEGLVDSIIFISPAEAFTAYLKVIILTGFVASFPVIIYHLWAFLSPAFEKKKRKRIIVWLVLALALFFAGITFSYSVAIPTALKFLIAFGKNIAVPAISLGKYISFFGALILAGGMIFEIPVVIGLLADVGMLRSSSLRKKRHIAVLAIMVVAAVITPTQDILNMLIFAVPMILLYEMGILIARIIEKKNKQLLTKKVT